MTFRTQEHWRDRLSGKSFHEQARIILADLAGYPKRPVGRLNVESQDVPSLANALLALRDMARNTPFRPTGWVKCGECGEGWKPDEKDAA